MKRKLAFCLALLMLLASCSETPVEENDDGAKTPQENQTPQAQESVEETEEELKPDLPEGYSFGGREFTILHNEYPVVGWTQYDIDAEEMNGTTINDAVYIRNSRVEADYDCVIVGDKVNYGTLHSRIPTLVRADDDSVDIATPLFWCGNLSNMTLEGFFLDMNTIDSMNLKQPWYDQQSVEAFTIFDKIYSVVSDMTIGAQI
ncbi:MAG: hypothetical protein IJC71_00540, partial [Clostridia bacterium]|nr:hypothetical protein [Clostridia bacterium]